MIQAHISRDSFGKRLSGGGFFGSLKRFLALVAAFGVGALVLIAASVLAIATAIVGIIIAFVAMLLRFGAYRATPSARKSASTDTLQDSDILEAHRTARGWKVDG